MKQKKLVTITINKCKKVALPINSKMTLLSEICEEVDFRCKTGCCFSCLVKIIDGNHNLSQATPKEEASLKKLGYDVDKYRLLCNCKIYDSVSILTKYYF